MSSRTEETILSKDGTKLFVRQWHPATPKPVAHLVIVHGYLEHGGRYREFAEYLAAEHSISTMTFDLRGHGKSAGQRAYCWSIQDYFGDLEAAMKYVQKKKEKKSKTQDGDDTNENNNNETQEDNSSSAIPLFILAHSFGGLTFLDYARDKQLDEIAGAIVTCPFVDYADQLSSVKILASKVLGSLVPRLSLPVEELPAVNLTSDVQKQKEHDEDQAMLHSFTVGWALETLKAQARVRDTSPLPLSMPILYCMAENDKVSNPEAVAKVGVAIAQKDKTVVERKGELHEILNEVNRKETYKLVGEWIVNRSS